MKDFDLGRLVAHAEAASGMMNQVAGLLEDLATSLPKRQRHRSDDLLRQADLMRSASLHLMASAHVSPTSTSLVARAGRTAIAGVSALLIALSAGGVEGASGELTSRALGANDRAAAAIEIVVDASSGADEVLAFTVAVEQARSTLLSFADRLEPIDAEGELGEIIRRRPLTESAPIDNIAGTLYVLTDMQDVTRQIARALPADVPQFEAELSGIARMINDLVQRSHELG